MAIWRQKRDNVIPKRSATPKTHTVVNLINYNFYITNHTLVSKIDLIIYINTLFKANIRPVISN